MTKLSLRKLGDYLLAALLGGISGASVAGESVLTGSAFYKERIALPSNAVFEAVLEDVSLMDVAATSLGKAVVVPAGQVPIKFELPYDSAGIRQGRRYNVRGQITVDGELRFVTDTAHPVFTGGRQKLVMLMMRSVARRPKGTPEKVSVEPPFQDDPMHFLGLLPAANCQMQYQLDLFSNWAYFLRTVCFKNGVPGETRDDIGRWTFDAGKQRLALKGGREAPVFFSVINTTTLERLDLQGKRIDSELSHRLEDSRTVESLEPALPMQGMYRYQADVAEFRECLTGFRLPVLFEGDHAELERAYLSAEPQPGQELKVQVEGGIVHLPDSDGNGEKPHVLVNRFIKLLPRESCGNPLVDATLVNTYWRLTQLNDRPVGREAATRREAHLILRAEREGRANFSGSTGCNKLMGTYELDGRNINLTGASVAMTRMACPSPDFEYDMIEMLRSAERWSIKGDHLDLLGDGGETLARFEAIYF